MRRYEEPYGGRRTPPHSQPQPEQHQYEYQQPQYQQPQYQPEYQPYAAQQLPQQPPEQLYSSQNAPPINPAAHPDSSFSRLRAERRYSRGVDQTSPNPNPDPFQSPQPPPHRDHEGRYWGQDLGYTNTNSSYSETTPGVDNFGAQAGGGLTGIAMSIADANARESGLEAMRHTPGYAQHPQRDMSPHHEQLESPYTGSSQPASSTSLAPLGAAAFRPGTSTPQARPIPSISHGNLQHQDSYTDIPHRYSRNLDPNLTEFDPNLIEDDGDEGLEYRTPNRSSMLSLGHHSDRNVPAAGGAAATGGVMGVLGGLVGKNGNQGAQQYDPVHGHYAPNEYNLDGPEKSEWLSKQSTGRKKLRWFVGILAALLLLGAIAGGVVGGILGSRKSSSSSKTEANGQSADEDLSSNGDLGKDSSEIKKLMNNKGLHKVFPGVDYTPMYTQYPDCIHYPASQNNVTRDVAVLSQLTNTIRLYGTDCNQTEMVIHAIDRLGLKDKVKIWMGVWQDKNDTTNARQLEQMYTIFDSYGGDPFVGVIVGNEVLFRKDMTATELGTIISGVRTNLTSKGIKLPVASSDLGDNWTQAFANQVDYVMANIHPFFAGVDSKIAASWTWTFWQGKDAPLKTDPSKNIISETGWPSKGGTNCGEATTCTKGSLAAIPEMNNFMNDWVCQALANGTNYFWFEAFDEPWKWTFNEPGKEWEDQWGLMDVNRDLKPGVTIPDCGGKTVD